jgi:hypothetical protein
MVIILVTVLVGKALPSSDNEGYASECPHTSAGASLQSSDPSRQQSISAVAVKDLIH